MNILSEAVKWFGLGVSVVPVCPRSKVAAISWKQYETRLPAPEELIRWFERPCVICGKCGTMASFSWVLVHERGFCVLMP